MGAISIGLLRGNSTSRLHGTNLRIGPATLVCFLYHCSGLSTKLPHDGRPIGGSCGIRRERGIRVCRGRTLTRAFSLARIYSKNMKHMGYLGNYRDLGQAAAEIQARLPAQLHARCGATDRVAHRWPSDSPFRLRPSDPVPSGLYGHRASAPRATARRGRKLSAFLAALLFAASGAAQAKTISALTPSFFDVNKAIGSAA